MSKDTFKADVVKVMASVSEAQEEIHNLVIRAVTMATEHYNLERVDYLIKEARKVRMVPDAVLEAYLFLLFGGDTGQTKNGLPMIDKDKAYVRWNDKGNLEFKDANGIDRQYIAHVLSTIKWYDFIPKTIKPLNQVDSVLRVLRKAMKDNAAFSDADKRMVREMVEIAANAGHAEYFEK